MALLIDTNRGSPFYILTDLYINRWVHVRYWDWSRGENERKCKEKENQERWTSKDQFLLSSSISPQNSFFPKKTLHCFQTLGLITDHKTFHSSYYMRGFPYSRNTILTSEFAGPTNSCMNLGVGFKCLWCPFCCAFSPSGSWLQHRWQAQQVWAVSRNG